MDGSNSDETPELVETVVEGVNLEKEDELLVNDCAITRIVDATTAVEEMAWLEDALTAGESVALLLVVGSALLCGVVVLVLGEEGRPFGLVVPRELSVPVLLRDASFPWSWETSLGAVSVAVAVSLSVRVERTGSAGFTLSDVYVVVALLRQPSTEVFETDGRGPVHGEVGQDVREERCL